MTLLHSSTGKSHSPFVFECHPTLPLVVIGAEDGKVVVLNMQTKATVAEVQLKNLLKDRHRSFRACRWFHPTAAQPTVNQFVFVLSGELVCRVFVCTMKDIHSAAAAGASTIEARHFQVSVKRTYGFFAINSTNTLFCPVNSKDLVLVDLESGKPIIQRHHEPWVHANGSIVLWALIQFAPDNPHTLLVYQHGAGCFKYDLRSAECKEGRVSTSRPPKEWLVSAAEVKPQRLFPCHPKESSFFTEDIFSPDARFLAIGNGTEPEIRSVADGRILFKAQPTSRRCIFTLDGAYLMHWTGHMHIMSTADGLVRWSIQLPKFGPKMGEMDLEAVQPCPGQPDRFVCIGRDERAWISTKGNHKLSNEYRLFDVQVLMPAVEQPPSRAHAPPVATAAAAVAAAAASGPSSSSRVGVRVGPSLSLVSPSASPTPRSSGPVLVASAASVPVASSPPAVASSFLPLASDAAANSFSRVHQLRLEAEQMKSRHALEQLEHANRIIAEMQREQAIAAASPETAGAAPLQPGQVVVKREQLLDLHETAVVAGRQKRKAEDESKEEREKRERQATRHREEMELHLAERMKLMEARALEQKKVADQDEKIAQLDEKLENERMKTTCSICLSDAVEVVYSPCGHTACCSECDRSLHAQADRTDGQLVRCPICQQAIQSRVRVTSLQHSDQGQPNHQPEEEEQKAAAADQDHPMPPLGR